MISHSELIIIQHVFHIRMVLNSWHEITVKPDRYDRLQKN